MVLMKDHNIMLSLSYKKNDRKIVTYCYLEHWMRTKHTVDQIREKYFVKVNNFLNSE